MKLKILTTAILLTPLCFATPLRAENPEQVRQLLQSKSCKGCDLRGADLSGADLSFAILVGADLRGANLARANLSKADLSQANLSQANFQQANLNQAYLTNANLEQTNLVGASLNGTKGLPIMNPSIAQSRLPPLPPSKLPQLTLAPLPPLPSSPVPRLNVAPLPIAPLPPLSTPIPPVPGLPTPVQGAQATPPRLETNTPSQQPVNTYPPKLVQSFINACAKDDKIRGVNMQQVCTCSINKIQNEYTLNEFLTISLDMAQSKKPPEKVMQIAVECAFENLRP